MAKLMVRGGAHTLESLERESPSGTGPAGERRSRRAGPPSARPQDEARTSDAGRTGARRAGAAPEQEEN